MNNMIRLWNQNRRGIIAFIIVIVLIVILVQILNSMVEQQEKQKLENVDIISKEELPIESIITGEQQPIETTKSNVSIIEDFITKCNNKDTSGAYNLLTKECKDTLFPTETEFINNYYNIIFQKNRSYGIENYMNSSGVYIYKIKFYEDVLSIGKVNTSEVYQDYISIDTKSKEGSLNINSFVGLKQINKSKEQDGIEITVISKEIYMEYEKYNVKIENTSNKPIMINTNKKSQSINIEDTQGVKYEAYATQIADNLLVLNSIMAREYKIKINKIFNPDVSITRMNFEDIVDYESYLNLGDNVQRKQIKVEI